ncbi:Phosphatidylinositol 4-kinase beta, variant 2 [Balamuthia mandrillaris]
MEPPNQDNGEGKYSISCSSASTPSPTYQARLVGEANITSSATASLAALLEVEQEQRLHTTWPFPSTAALGESLLAQEREEELAATKNEPTAMTSTKTPQHAKSGTLDNNTTAKKQQQSTATNKNHKQKRRASSTSAVSLISMAKMEELNYECLKSMRGQLDLWSVLKALFKYTELTHQVLLTEELKRFELHQIEFYLPQLCNLVLQRESAAPLQVFLVILCERSVHIALRIYFFFKAAVEDNVPATIERATQLFKAFESLIFGPDSDESIVSFWIDELCIIRTLTGLATMLNGIPDHLQNQVLHFTLQQLNSRLSTGLYIPVYPANYPLHCILNISSEDAFCLSTKARTPYMVFIETAQLEGTFGTLEYTLEKYRKPKKSSIRFSQFRDGENSVKDVDFTGCPIQDTPELKRRKNSIRKNNMTPSASDDVGGLQRGHTRQVVDDDEDDENAAAASSERSGAGASDKEKPYHMLKRSLQYEGSHSDKAKKQQEQEKNKHTMTKAEILAQLEEMKEDIKVRAFVETPLGDSYYINSVEEFYCDVATVSITSSHHKVAARDGEGSDDGSEDLEEHDWVVIENVSDSMKCKQEFMSMAYRELWYQKKQRIKKNSPCGDLPGWDLMAVIVKSEDDLRQEQLAMQLIKCFKDIWEEAGLPLWLRTYEIVAVSSKNGFIEVIQDAVSIDSIKKRFPNSPTLADYFICTYGNRESRSFRKAQKNFVESLAAYSIVCYLLQIKDRHNGNIMMDIYGHIIHIDYGFFLSSSPGNWNFETAPFKLTAEYMQLLGGENSEAFKHFKFLFFKGFLEARRHYERIVLLVEMMLPGTFPLSLCSFFCFTSHKQ